MEIPGSRAGKGFYGPGEVNRIISRIEHGMLDNGSINWDEYFRRMLRMLSRYFRMGDPINPREYDHVENCIDAISDCGEGEKEIKEIICPHTARWSWMFLERKWRIYFL